jgi:hypothetical protein
MLAFFLFVESQGAGTELAMWQDVNRHRHDPVGSSSSVHG